MNAKSAVRATPPARFFRYIYTYTRAHVPLLRASLSRKLKRALLNASIKVKNDVAVGGKKKRKTLIL